MPRTNPQFPHFRQEHFTAGTEEQFLECTEERHPLRITPYHTQGDRVPALFQNIDPAAKIGTFHYLFYKFKKGIFIRIRGGRLDCFLPFSNADYKNEWHARISVPAAAAFQAPVERWYANNYLFRHEWPPNEGDTGHAAIKHMFETVCAERNINDLDVFVNRRDFPLLREDGSEPYDAIYGPSTPLVSFARAAYLPLLSMVQCEGFADQAIPTAEDWARACAQQSPPGYFLASKRSSVHEVLPPIPWQDKIQQVVFRGSSTGRGVGAANARIRLTQLVRGDPRFNVGITANSDRWHIESGRVIPPEPCELVSFMPPSEQRKYKFVLHVDGHVRGFRLSHEFSYGSVLLIAGARYRLWFEKYLIDGVHYIAVAEDFSDLLEKVDWCFQNDERAAEIARAAQRFFQTNLCRAAILDELAATLNVLAIHARPQKDYLAPPLPPPSSFWPAFSSRAPPPAHPVPRDYYSLSSFWPVNSGRAPPHARAVGWTLNRLLQDIPNFAYTYPDGSVEAPAGILLEQYLKSYEFLLTDCEFILQQIALALRVAQRYLSFTHHSLSPKTVWLHELPAPTTFDYILGEEQVVRIVTRRVPILFSFEQSFVEGIQKIRGFDSRCDLDSLVRATDELIVKFQMVAPGQLKLRGGVQRRTAEYFHLGNTPLPARLPRPSLFRRYLLLKFSRPCVLEKEPYFIPYTDMRLARCYLEDMLTFGGPNALDEGERDYVKHVLQSINV